MTLQGNGMLQEATLTSALAPDMVWELAKKVNSRCLRLLCKALQSGPILLQPPWLLPDSQPPIPSHPMSRFQNKLRNLSKCCCSRLGRLSWPGPSLLFLEASFCCGARGRWLPTEAEDCVG